MGTVILITGGVRSGKSAWALSRADTVPAGSKIFIATAEAVDEEMRERIRTHRNERGEAWKTIEEPLDIAGAIRGLPASGVAVVDCCTVWLGNIWHSFGHDDATLRKHVDAVDSALRRWKHSNDGVIIMVSNEVGWGIVPPDPGVRRYRDWAGRLNQRIAAIADEVYLSVAGIAVTVKHSGGPGRNTRGFGEPARGIVP